MKPGDMVQLVEKPWSVYAGECVMVLRVDEDGKGFDFVVPEQRGHAPARFVARTLGNFDLEKLGVKL